MSYIKIENSKCTLCLKCIEVCPFDAMSLIDNSIEINSNCKVCGICVKNCPEKCILKIDEERTMVDKSKYVGIAVVAESHEGKIHPVVTELLAKARELGNKINHPTLAYVLGDDVDDVITDCFEYGADKVIVVRHPELHDFRSDLYGQILAEVIGLTMPSVVLTGATPLGRSLAPSVAARLKTGLTADCTKLEIKQNTDLVQIRPAFGGNIMAQIVTRYHRPQCATVRYNVFRANPRVVGRTGEVLDIPFRSFKATSRITVLDSRPLKHDEALVSAEKIIVAGLGVNDKAGLELVNRLAKLLDATIAYTRPMVEKGSGNYTRQIGLSGRTVKPKLIITCGVSGSVQFAAGMQNSDRIIAINKDPEASIFSIAHVAVVGDCYEVLPKWIEALEKGDYHAI